MIEKIKNNFPMSRYKIKIVKCCVPIDEGSKRGDIRIELIPPPKPMLEERITVGIDYWNLKYCPFCGKEFEFKLIKEE